MDASRVSVGELIAGASGLLLFVFLFLDWISPEGIDGANAWQLFDFMDILLAVIGLGVALLVVARAAGVQVGPPGGVGAIVGLAGFAAFWIVLTFVIEGDERGAGLWLALLAAIGITFGGLTAARGRPAARAGTPPTPPPAV